MNSGVGVAWEQPILQEVANNRPPLLLTGLPSIPAIHIPFFLKNPSMKELPSLERSPSLFSNKPKVDVAGQVAVSDSGVLRG